MKNYWKHIDDFFREKLGRYKEVPPADVWEALDKRLDGLAPAPVSNYRWVKHAAIIAALIVLSVPLVKKYAGNTTDATKDIAANAATSTVQAAQTAAKTANTTVEAAGNTTAQQGVTAMANAANTVTSNSTTGNTHSTISTGNNYNKTQHILAANKYIRTKAARHTTANKKRTNSGHTTADTNDNDVVVNEHIYHGSNANPAPLDETNNDQSNLASPKQTLSPASPAIPAAGKMKKDIAGNAKTAVAKKMATSNDKAGFSRFEAGIKAGFEGGFDNNAAQKLVVSPYLQYNLSRKFAIMVQPAVKGANMAEHSIGDSRSYYRLNDDGTVVLDGVVGYNTAIVGGVVDTTGYIAKYTATQKHDSIVKSYKYGGYYTELELPILLKYNVTKNISVYGGVNVLYTRTSGVVENTATTYGIAKSADVIVTTPANPVGIAVPPAQSIINYNGNSIKEYENPYANVVKTDVRLGYMIGVTYQYKNRWLADALIEQSPYKPQTVNNVNLNAPLSSTYFRLSIGYKLTK